MRGGQGRTHEGHRGRPGTGRGGDRKPPTFHRGGPGTGPGGARGREPARGPGTGIVGKGGNRSRTVNHKRIKQHRHQNRDTTGEHRTWGGRGRENPRGPPGETGYRAGRGPEPTRTLRPPSSRTEIGDHPMIDRGQRDTSGTRPAPPTREHPVRAQHARGTPSTARRARNVGPEGGSRSTNLKPETRHTTSHPELHTHRGGPHAGRARHDLGPSVRRRGRFRPIFRNPNLPDSQQHTV